MTRKLLKNTLIVSAMTLVSRVLGLLRDMVLAWFGATAGMDAFFVAFKIPNFLRRLFAEGAFSQAFVPIISEYREKRSHEEVQGLVDKVAGTLGGVLVLITVVGVLASPLVITVFAPGFLYTDSVRFDLASQLLRITFPYILFISLVAFAAGILNTYGRFATPSLTPVWLNVVLIGAALLVAPRLERPVFALACGVFVAGVVQVLYLLPSLRRIGLLPRPRWGFRDEGVRRIMKLMLPGIFGSSVAQINLLLDTLIASFLVTGSVTWLYYSDRLVEFPLGVFAIALSTVILPSLSRSHANASDEEFSATLDWGMRLVLLIGIPSAVGLIVLARPVLATLFLYHDFTDLGRAHVGFEPDDDVVRVAGLHADQGAGPGILLAQGSAYAGAHRGDCPGDQLRFQPDHRGADGAPGGTRPACGTGAGDVHRRLCQCRAAVPGFVPPADLPATRRMEEIPDSDRSGRLGDGRCVVVGSAGLAGMGRLACVSSRPGPSGLGVRGVGGLFSCAARRRPAGFNAVAWRTCGRGGRIMRGVALSPAVSRTVRRISRWT